MTEGQTTHAAGWYDDPQNAAQVRYWDGAAWTAHVSPHPNATVPPAPPAAFPRAAVPAEKYGPDSPVHYLVPVGRSWESVTSPWLGVAAFVFSLVPFLGFACAVAAIWIGILALRKAKAGGHGTGRAVTGIVLGSLALVASTVITIAIFAAGAFGV